MKEIFGIVAIVLGLILGTWLRDEPASGRAQPPRIVPEVVTVREPAPLPDGPPIIVWNHRWEFDKNPKLFFSALDRVDQMGIDFRLAILGENCQVKPRAFLDAKARFGAKVVQYGYVPSKRGYTDWLGKGLVAVSTAIQENFGIAMVEAMRHGCLPLLPNRLSYPEILPKEFHDLFLYRDDDDLVNKLAMMLLHPDRFVHHRPVLSDMMARHAWSCVIGRYDRELELMVQSGRPMTGYGLRRPEEG